MRWLLLLGLVLPAAVIGTTQSSAQTNDRLVIGMTFEPPHLDPTAGAPAAIDEVVYANVFQGLTRIDETGAIQPQLATDWTVSDDDMEYVFSLKPGVTFHDGTALDASDVVFSLDRARGDDSVNAQKPLFAAIDTVEAIDDTTVRITLTRPEQDLLFNLGWGDAVIVAPESAEENKTNPIGTGPFRFSRWLQGDSVELTAIDEAAPLQTVVFKFISDASAQVAALLAGDIDAFPNLAAPETVARFEADSRFEVVIGDTEGETILSTNNARAPFDDLRVRQAIAHAIDRRQFIDGAYFGYGTPIGSHFSPLHPAYIDLTDRYPLDLEKAKGLLADAGFPNGFSATLKLPPAPYAERGGEVIAAQLARINIDLELIPVPWATWVEQVFLGHDFDLTIVSHTEPVDIGIYNRDGYYFNYRSSELAEVLDEFERATDPDKRHDLLRTAQRIVADDAVNGFIFQLPKLGVWRAGLTGLWANSPVQANDVTEVRWVQ